MKISINVVHTNYGNHHLFKNETILSQLHLLSKASSLYEINLLFNGLEAVDNYTKELQTNEKLKEIVKSKSVNIQLNPYKVMTHGAAIQRLHEMTETDWYILIDEDDEFRKDFLYSLRQFIEVIHNHNLSSYLVMYGFNWMYINSKNKLSEKKHPIEELNEKLDSVAGLSNWNFLFNKKTLDKLGLVRPDINKYDDNLYYLKLYQAYKGKCLFLNYNLINYRKDHSTLSVDNRVQLDDYMNYLLSGTGFEVIKTIS